MMKKANKKNGTARFAEDSEPTKSSVARVTVCISVRIANVRYKKSSIPKGR